MLFWMTGGQQTLLSFFGVNQHCYLSCGYYHFEIASSFLTQAGNPPGLRGVCICDQSLLWTGQHGRWQSASSEDPVLQLQLLTQKSIELVQLFTSLFGLHYYIFLIKAIDCLRSRLLIKKDKGIDNWLVNAVRPLPAQLVNYSKVKSLACPGTLELMMC